MGRRLFWLPSLVLAAWLGPGLPAWGQGNTPPKSSPIVSEVPWAPYSVFDIDDTLIHTNTKIYLYRNGINGREELAVSTADFPRVIKLLGQIRKAREEKVSPDLSKDVLAKYEGFDFDPDPLKGSMRDFGDRIDKKAFSKAVKVALDEGNVGPAISEYLHSVKNFPRNTFALTAREHHPTNIQPGLALIDQNTPPIENIVSINNSEVKAKILAAHPELKNPSNGELKAAVMRDWLDDLARKPVPSDAPLIHNQNGTGNERLHLWSFYDDDPENVKAAVRVLSAAIKADPERWRNIKIQIVFVPRNKANRRTVVLKTDGSYRDPLSDEPLELQLGKKVAAELADAKPKRARKFSTLQDFQDDEYKFPESNVQKSKLKTIDDSIDKVHMSENYETMNTHVVTGSDLVGLEAREMQSFIDEPSTPNSLKKIILNRYTVDSPRIIDALIDAKKKGVRVQFTWDLNTNLKFPPSLYANGPPTVKDRTTTNFSEALLGDNKSAAALKRLLDAGYKYNDPEWGIFSQPLYFKDAPHENRIDPIGHEKFTAFVVEGDDDHARSSKLLISEGNLTESGRINKTFVSTDQAINEAYLVHADLMAHTYADGGHIKDIGLETPYRSVYADGSFREVAFTNGQTQVNQRIIDLLRKAAEDPENFKITNVKLAQFAPTNTKVFNVLKLAMNAQPGFGVDLVVDDKFADTRSWGVASTTKGYKVFRPSGQVEFGWSNNFVNRVNMSVYQRKIADRFETEVDGYPWARFLYHSKMTLIKVSEKNPKTGQFEDWVYAFDGSMNLSNHFENAETQEMWRMPANSNLAKALEEGFTAGMKANPEHYLSVDRAFVRGAMAHMTGHSVFEVPLEAVDHVLAARKNNDVAAIETELRALLKTPTTITAGVTDAHESRVNDFIKILNWRMKFNKYPLSAPTLVSVMQVMGMPEVKENMAKVAMNDLLWSPNLSKGRDSLLDIKIREAYKVWGRAFPAKADKAAPEDITKAYDNRLPTSESAQEAALKEAALRDCAKKLLENSPVN